MPDHNETVNWLRGAIQSPNVEDRSTETTLTVDQPSQFEKQFGMSPKEAFFEYPRSAHTNNPLAKALGYNDIKKPSAIDTLEFMNFVENFNDPWKGGTAPVDPLAGVRNYVKVLKEMPSE